MFGQSKNKHMPEMNTPQAPASDVQEALTYFIDFGFINQLPRDAQEHVQALVNACKTHCFDEEL